MSVAVSEELAHRLMQQLQALEQRAIDLSQREAVLADMLKTSMSAVEAVTALDGKDDDSETLFPVGMGVFVKARVASKDSLIVNVGSGASVEKDRGSTLSFLEAKITEIRVALQDASAKRQEALESLEQGRQEASRALRPGAPRGG